MGIQWLGLLGGIVLSVGLSRQNRPDHPENDLFRDGDLLIGMLAGYTYDYRAKCDLINEDVVQATHGLKFAIDELNNDPAILPNITLGMVALDDCWDPAITLYRAMKFVPPDDCTGDCCRKPYMSTSRTSARGCYDVISVIAPKASTRSLVLSQLLGQFEIPHISYMATSDELSNKVRYPYFSRIVPPDRFQAQLMMDVLEFFNWTYISVLRYNTDYGRDGANNIISLANARGICIAYSAEMLEGSSDDEDYDRVVRDLRIYKKAKVVVGFLERSYYLLEAVKRAGAQGEFIFFFADGSVFLYSDEIAINSLSIWFQETQRKHLAFIKYYSNLSPWSFMTEAGWYELPSIYDVKCTWNVPKNVSSSCHNYKTMGDLPGFEIQKFYVNTIDIVKVIALAVQRLVAAVCPEAFQKKEILRSCINGSTLQEYIRNVSFDGYSGRIQFDSNGDGYPVYTLSQWQWKPKGSSNYSYATVATWTPEGLRLVDKEGGFRWFEWRHPGEVTPTAVPESVCAKPCKPGESYIQGRLKCCWECHRCRDNEMVREDQRGCVQCPELTWPNQANFTTCEDIPPTYMLWLDPIAISLCSLSAIGILSTLMITYVFLRYSNKKAIKGSSIEQMMTIIVAILTSYVTVLLLVMKPNTWSCRIAFVTFHSSCTLIFVPLLLKTTRLYRIFRAAEKCQQEIKFVSKGALGFASVLLTLILVGQSINIEIPYRWTQKFQHLRIF